MFRHFLSIALIYIFAATLTSCRDKKFVSSGAVWGTTYHISYTAPADLNDSIQVVFGQINSELSMFDPSSRVSRINSGATDTVTPMFAEVFDLSKRISALTAGAFDPTVGPLTDLWGFGRVKVDEAFVPDSAAIAATLSAVGIADCRIDGTTIVKKSPDTRFDFSAVAKGYGVDAVVAMLLRNGASDILVEIGGEVAVAAVPDGDVKRIQIDAPVVDDGNPSHQRLRIVSIADGAIATSGNYRNFRRVNDRQFGHTINPRTGYPQSNSTLSATVIAPDCATADALATACMVMHADSALALINSLHDIHALLVIAAADSCLVTTSTDFPGSKTSK